MKLELAWIYFAKCIICYKVNDVIDLAHVDWLKARNNIQCGYKPKDMSGRVINGRSVEKPYPWLFHVLKRTKFWNDEKTGSSYEIKGSMGALITETAILTCGHCICNQKYSEKAVKGYHCLYGADTDQNQPMVNMIVAYFSNNTLLDYDDEFFDREYIRDKKTKLRAYLYKYDPRPPVWSGTFSINGDIGIIILPQSAIPGVGPMIAPICLPNTQLLSKEKKMYVRLVGNGLRYHETERQRRTNTSCMTNNAMYKRQNLQGRRHAFLPCQRHVMSDLTANSYCEPLTHKLFPSVSNGTLPINIEVGFKYIDDVSGNGIQRNVTITNRMGSKCAEYIQKLSSAIEGMPKSALYLLSY